MFERIKKIKRGLKWKRSDMHWADGTVFMNRWTIYDSEDKDFSIKIHCFRYSDQEIHNHPWSWFSSIIIWGRYKEEVRVVVKRVKGGEVENIFQVRRGFLSYRKHPSDYAHRVLVDKGKKCWTICFTGKKDKEWGFFTDHGWIAHNALERNNGRGRIIR